ncbi:MAG: glycosyltransferase family 4 protein [Saprospiraceae bacterium]|nr:glycosyltransferase family 4 protein [Saprospiraceae bacterium]
MKIINIVPGFGGTFYCGNCLRDSSFVKHLNKAGHEGIILPIYLPLSITDENEILGAPVFYGAINIYLKQKFKLFRKMPSWMKKFFNSSFFLRYAAKKAGSTRADGLEEMTISMLKGAEGNQKEELDELIAFLAKEKPDIVHLSNALLLGFADEIKNRLNIPVVCSLQDEDVWIDPMTDDYQKMLWELLSEKGKSVSAFVSVSIYFASLMKSKMNISDEKLHIVPIGVTPDLYDVKIPNTEIPTIAYLSRMNEENGFGILIDAFIELKENTDFKNARLKLNGGNTGDDKRFINKQIKKLNKKGYFDDVEFDDDYEIPDLKEFFKDVTVLSVPVLKGEAFGLYQLQALASGIPIVQPALGAFPEIVELTEGGAVYSPNTPAVLAKKWAEVFSDEKALNLMSKNGRKAVVEKFNSVTLTQKMIEVYKKCI